MRRCFQFGIRDLSLRGTLPSLVTGAYCRSRSSLKVYASPQQHLQPFTTFPQKMNTPIPSQDSAANAGVEYMFIEDVEKLERYRPGGYHPMCIGDLLHQRYFVVHKLGFGTHSTTWLARDQEASRYVAIKVAVAASSSNEKKIIHQLNATDLKHPVHPGKAAISPLLEEFFLHGPNGKHRCLVTLPARMTVVDAQEASYNRLFQLPVARVIVAQLVQAVAFVHSQGVVHGGECSQLTHWNSALC